jgi:S-adenosylhomocysteine hydrolase
MVKYTTTSTGKKAIVGSKHVIDGRTFEVMADGKMKNLGKASASTPAKSMAKPMAKPAGKAKPAAKPAAKKVTSPVVPKRRPSSTEMHAARMNKLTGYKTGGGF